jgi:hypothetical protein
MTSQKIENAGSVKAIEVQLRRLPKGTGERHRTGIILIQRLHDCSALAQLLFSR